jgi:hypothetical protein
VERRGAPTISLSLTIAQMSALWWKAWWVTSNIEKKSGGVNVEKCSGFDNSQAPTGGRSAKPPLVPPSVLTSLSANHSLWYKPEPTYAVSFSPASATTTPILSYPCPTAAAHMPFQLVVDTVIFMGGQSVNRSRAFPGPRERCHVAWNRVCALNSAISSAPDAESSLMGLQPYVRLTGSLE